MCTCYLYVAEEVYLSNAVLTIIPQIIIKELEERETVPCVWGLHLKGCIHINSKQGPKDLSMFHKEITEPSKCLSTYREDIRNDNALKKVI